MKTDPKNFVEALTQKCAPLEKKLCGLYWQLATTGEASVAKQLSQSEKEIKLIFSNRAEFEQLKKWKAEGIADPLVARQIDLLVKSYTPNQLDEKTIEDLVDRQTEIENIFNNFRAEFDGKPITNNDLKEILKSEKTNGRRKTAWEAYRQVGPQVADKVVELARRRNKAAQTLGFANHFKMSLTLQELDGVWLNNLFHHLKKKTEEPFRKSIGALHQKLASHYSVPVNTIMPWHYDDPFAQSAPTHAAVDLDPFLAGKDILKICRDFYSGIDLDISDVLEKSDLLERKGKSQHAFCITMDRGSDVRVLANLRPNSYWASTMLHELGHAAYSKNISSFLPHFLRDEAHIFATEAIAMLMERMIHHPQWLERMEILSPKEMETYAPALWEGQTLDKLIIARWVMLVTNFEEALYTNPDQDLNGVWWKLVKDFQLLEKPSGRSTPDWAAKIHISSHPVYYHNYLLGELFAAQIAETLEREALKKSLSLTSFWRNRKVGQLLKEKMFKMGSQWPWPKLVAHVSGQTLSSDSFVSQFCA